MINVSTDVTSDLLHVFLVGHGSLLELGNLLFELENLIFGLGNFLVVIGNLLVIIGSHRGTLNLTLYSVHGGYLVLIPLTIAGAQVSSCVNYYSMLLLPLNRFEPAI